MKGNGVEDENGEILYDQKQTAERWKRYIEGLYEGINGGVGVEDACEINQDNMGTSILWYKSNLAVKCLKDKKATGIYDIPSEIIKAAGDKALNELFLLVQEMYESRSSIRI